MRTSLDVLTDIVSLIKADFPSLISPIDQKEIEKYLDSDLGRREAVLNYLASNYPVQVEENLMNTHDWIVFTCRSDLESYVEDNGSVEVERFTISF